MIIDFYEEFPNKETLEKLRLIKFPMKIFIAAKSVKEFQKYEKIAKNYKKDLEVAYWPIIKNSYWVSPFSNTGDLIELFNELNKIQNSLLIDLELPLAKRGEMYLKNIFHFKKNKKLIRNFLEKNKEKITTAEYPFKFILSLVNFLGLNYNIKNEKSIMFYSSMSSKKVNERIKKNLQKIKDKNNYSISLGTIAIGILGDEPILPPDNLKEDLQFVKNIGFKKVIIFRLGGLNKEYVKVIEKFIKN